MKKIETKNGFTFVMTEDEYHANENDYIGICIACGEERESCEPDARRYPCEECGKKQVYGTPELLVMGRIGIDEEES